MDMYEGIMAPDGEEQDAYIGCGRSSRKYTERHCYVVHRMMMLKKMDCSNSKRAVSFQRRNQRTNLFSGAIF